MKREVKKLITNFEAGIDYEVDKYSVTDTSYFLAFSTAVILLYKNLRTESFYSGKGNFKKRYEKEITIVKERFPAIFNSFSLIEAQLDVDFQKKLYNRLEKLIFKSKDHSDIDELISWTYQFLKKDLEKIAYSKVRNEEKIEGQDLLFTTQFFTDKYMVNYLVDNVIEKLKDSNKIAIIDPAAGGGNFLTVAFDRLYPLIHQKRENWSPQKIVDEILENYLLGYDLDYSLSRIAALTVFVKACQYAIPSKTTAIKIFGGFADDEKGFLASSVRSKKIKKTTFQKELARIKVAGAQKVFLTNPPFMGKRDMSKSLKEFLLTKYPESKGDLCISFLQRILQIKESCDIIGVVTQNNWMYLSSLKEFRKIILQEEFLDSCADLGSKSFADIGGEKSNVSLCIFTSHSDSLSAFYDLRYFDHTKKKKTLSSNKFLSEVLVGVSQNLFLKNKNFEFIYTLRDQFNSIHSLPIYEEYGNPMQGTSTGDNSSFVKKAWEVKDDPDWKPVSKGGGFSKWIGLNYNKVNWGSNAEKIKENKGSALRNISKIPFTQLVYSDTGTLGLTVRVLKKNQVFIASGPGIQVLEGNVYSHLAFLNSKVATFLLKVINPKFTVSAGYISKLPVGENILNSETLAEKGKECLKLKLQYLESKLPNIEYNSKSISRINDYESFINKNIINDLRNDYDRLSLEHEIECEIKNHYKFNKYELSKIEEVVGVSPFEINKKEVTIPIEDLDKSFHSLLDINGHYLSKRINGFAVGSESIIENLSKKYNIHPQNLFSLLKQNILDLKKTKEIYLDDFRHKVILHILGFSSITEFENKRISLVSLNEQLMQSYPELFRDDNMKNTVLNIINNHHLKSFMKSPLMKITDDSKYVLIG